MQKTPADVFPLVIPCNEENTAYEGYLDLPCAGSLRTSMWIRLCKVPADKPTIKGSQLECSVELADLLQVTSCSLVPSSMT